MDWDYFSYDTDTMLACPCCNFQGMDETFMKNIDRLRDDCGFPFIVTSGYRCPRHNSRVSSTGGNGPHTTGKAIDLRVSGEKAHKLLSVVFSPQYFGYPSGKPIFTGIGIQQKGPDSTRFIHLDSCQNPYPRPWVWSY